MNGAESGSFATAADGCRLFFCSTGPMNAPAIIFSHALGTTHAMWDLQAAALVGTYRVVRYDSRGHGRSDVPAGPYSIANLAADAVAVLDAAGIARATFCGLSLGGMVGQAAAAAYPDRFDALIVANSAAQLGTAASWNERIDAVKQHGMTALRDGILERWFTPGFRAEQHAAVARIGAMLDATEPAGYAASCAAIRDMDQRESIASITVPTLVIVGTRDPATPPADGEFIARRIPHARIIALDAAHLSNVECAAAFTAALTTMTLRAT